VAKRFRVLSSKTIYDGRVLRLKVDRVIEPGGVRASREVVSHRGSVVVLPHLADGRVLLVRQFRYATGKSLWELVAGGIEPGETPAAAASRELLEETGYSAGKLEHLFSFYPSPGFLSERMILFEGRGLVRSTPQPESDERIRLGRFTPTELRSMLRSKRIEDGKTLLGLLWLLGFKEARRR
jgi:ADP-ribose pyrophosphatase